jgi:hypothetical protein
MDALNTTMMVDRPDGPEQRRSKIVPAARWVSIDYRSIVANAVEGLADNTPGAMSMPKHAGSCIGISSSCGCPSPLSNWKSSRSI